MLKTLLIGLAFHSLAWASINVSILKEFHPLEANSTQVWHAGYLWSGDSAAQGIDVFDGNGKKVTFIKIPHFVRFVSAGNPDTVIVTGKTYEETMESHLSTIRVRDFKVTTRKLAEPLFTLSMTNDPKGQLYFGDVPERSLATLEGSRIRRFGPQISAPTHITQTGNSLWVVESFGVGMDVANLIHYDLKTKQATRLFEKETLRGRLFRLFSFPEHNLVFASETVKDQVLAFDTQSKTLAFTLAIPGAPRAMAKLGKCLAVLSEESREIRFYDLKKSQTPLATWDLSSVGTVLKNPHSLDIDPKTGKAFVRSSIPCMQCQQSPNALALAEEPEGTTFRLCH